MTTKSLSADDYNFIEAMHEAVIHEPVGYIYVQDKEGLTNCTYLPTDSTVSCIVGRGLLDGEFTTPETLKDYEGKSASQVLIGDKSYGKVEPVSERTAALHPDVVDMAEKVQGWQDGSMPWTAAWNMGVMYLVGKGHEVAHYFDHRDWPNNPNA